MGIEKDGVIAAVENRLDEVFEGQGAAVHYVIYRKT